MAKKERFGKFVLLEELGSSGLGSEYRAAKLAAGGALERLVLLVRLDPALSANHAFTSELLEQTKAASLLHGPNILKLIAIGRVESAYYVAYEHLEGKSLKAVLERSRREAFPFTPDHALAISSRLCAALEYAHGKQDAQHGRHVHGLVTPGALFLTHDGEVKLRGFGIWAAGAFKAGAIAADERRHLAPEQAKSGVAQVQTDLYGAGALLFEMLTGQPLVADVEADPAERVKQARLAGGAEGEGLPQPMAEILRRALAADPKARFGEMAEMRKAVDALLYSGQFNPTTFNLAFFMHSLFREDIERDARNAAEEAAASYTEYWVVEDVSRPAPTAVRAATSPEPSVPRASPPSPPPAEKPAPAAAPPSPMPVAAPVAPLHPPEPPAALRAEPPPRPREPFPALEMEGPAQTPVSTQRHASVSPVPPKPELKSRSPLPLPALAAALVVAAGGAAGWYFLAGPGARRPEPPPTTLSAETIAAQARVRELEAKLQRFEEERAQAEARAAEEAKQKLEAQAAAKGQAVDPAALRKAQEDARLRAQREQERKQQQERRVLEEQQQAAEARLAEERRRAAAAAAAATPAPAPPTTTLPPAPPAPTPPPPTTAAALKPGTLLNISDFGVIPPTLDRAAPLVYPPIARQQRAEGTVELSVLIDEKGNVAEARLVKGAPGIGLNQAALDHVRRRKYRPATKDGVPVKVYLSVLVKFEIPR